MSRNDRDYKMEYDILTGEFGGRTAKLFGFSRGADTKPEKNRPPSYIDSDDSPEEYRGGRYALNPTPKKKGFTDQEWQDDSVLHYAI
jgi:hypothetical protein